MEVNVFEKKYNMYPSLSLVHTSNFVGNFVFLTDANERSRTQKYRVAFQT
jgi:hypothetical protein